jgi:uncharacterized protein with PQ loop repeat
VTSESLVTVANVLQSCVPLLSLTAYLPQWRRLAVTKSSKDISMHAWFIWCFSGAITLFYAVMQYLVTGQGTALIFSSATALTFVVITAYMVFRYRHGAQPKNA